MGVMGVAKIMHVLWCVSIEIYTISTFSFNVNVKPKKEVVFIIRKCTGLPSFFEENLQLQM